jgi:hypothetical protein
VKHAIERLAGFDTSKPRVTHPIGKPYHFKVVAVCKEWVESERAYNEKIDELTAQAEASKCAERTAEVKAMKAERAPITSCAALLTNVRNALKGKGYK